MSTSQGPRATTGPAAGASHGAGGTSASTPQVGGAARAAATGLWVLVGAGLTYGVVQTVIRAAQLFT